MSDSSAMSRQPRPKWRRYSLWRLLRANLYDLGLLLRESSLALVVFLVVLLIGVLYFHAVYHFRLVMDVYEAVKLLFFQSSESLPTDPLGDLLFFLVPVLGLALIVQGVLNFGRLVLDKGSRREAWQVALAATYRRHIIVCGLGHVGLRVIVQLLAAGAEVVVIERDWASEFVPRALALKVPVVVGDAREPAALHQAGLRKATAVIAVINDDLLNIEIALTARAGRPGIRVVLRVFNEELDRRLEWSFGANAVFSAQALAAPTFAAAAVSHQLAHVLTLEGGPPLGVTSLAVPPGSDQVGKPEVLEQRFGVRLLAAQDVRGRPLPLSPQPEIPPGARLTLLGPLAALEGVRHLPGPAGWETGSTSPGPPRSPGAPAGSPSAPAGQETSGTPPAPAVRPTTSGRKRRQREAQETVIVCGLGTVGYRVVQQLHQLTPRPRIVVVHLNDARSVFAPYIRHLSGVTSVIGDLRDEDLFQRAGIERASAVAALTSNDMVNLQIGLAARRLRPEVHLVLRVFSDALAEKLTDLFGISTTYSTSALAAPTLAAAAMLGGINQACMVENQVFALDQLPVCAGDRFSGSSVAAIRAGERALVVALRRQGQTTTLPAQETILAPNDLLTVLAPVRVLAQLRGQSSPRPL